MYNCSGRTSLHSYTTHHDGVHIFKNITYSTSTGNTASGAVTVDLSTHPVYEFTINGNITSLQFDNAKEGGEYIFIVYNSGSYTITSSGVTLGGVSGTVFAKGGSLNPTNSGYTKYRLVIINGKGWLDEELNFQAL